MSSDKLRLLVFSIFLLLLIVFGMVYRPADALSQPRSNGNPGAAQPLVPRK